MISVPASASLFSAHSVGWTPSCTACSARSAAGAATVLGDYRGIVLCDGDAAVLLTERRVRAVPVVEPIRTWVTQQRALPHSTLGKALAYRSQLWPGLVRSSTVRRSPSR